MKISKLSASLIVAVVMLASCALIPPIPLGPNALGFDGQVVPVGTVPASGFAQLSSLSNTHSFGMENIEPPNMPIAPSSLQAVQGFEPTVRATRTLSALPDTITIDSGSLEVTVEDDSGSPSPVETTVSFGPLTLNRDENCGGSDCHYTFADPAEAARSLTMTVRGDSLSRLLKIMTEGQVNTVTVRFRVETAEQIDSLTFTIDVEENYIRF